MEARDVDGIVHELSARAAGVGVGSASLIAERLLERERAHPTVVGAGLAIPHATVPGLEDPVIGIGRSDDPIDFGPPDLGPVRVFFVLLSPTGQERLHVKLLARICRLGRHHDFIGELVAAESEEGIIEVVGAMDRLHV